MYRNVQKTGDYRLSSTVEKLELDINVGPIKIFIFTKIKSLERKVFMM